MYSLSNSSQITGVLSIAGAFTTLTILAAQTGSPAHLENELGDLLFSLVELGRRKGVKANAALAKANAKFLHRFEAMETLARQRGLDFAALEFSEQDALWNEVKAAEKDNH